MTTISLSSSRPDRLKVDALVVGVVDDGGRLAFAAGGDAVEAAMGRDVLNALTALGAETRPGTVTKLPTAGALRAPVLAVVGLGEAATAGDPERLRRAAGTAVRALAGVHTVGLALPVRDATSARAVAEGALLGAYAFNAYKSDTGKSPVAEVTLLAARSRDKAVATSVEAARQVAAAVNTARDWVNMAPNDLTPEAFATLASALAKESGLSHEVLDEAALRKDGYGGILAVGQGSTHPPRLVRLVHRPRKPVAKLAYVGKGITFDSGGLSIKTSEGMLTMKCDMAGAAAVVSATAAIARLGLPVEIVAYAALAENMPSGTAQRPSDVYRAYGGRTVEVLNTDAEGRLVLADAIVRAGEDGVDAIIDVATLTGAVVVALGPRVAGVMGNDDALRESVVASAARAGEQVWPLPLPEELREKLDSPVADIANVGDRWGGGLQAGLFLREFVPPGHRWAHLDMAGPSFNSEAPHDYTPKGGTGAAVRTLVALAEAAAEGRLT